MDALPKIRGFFAALENCHGDMGALRAVFTRHYKDSTISRSLGPSGRDLVGADAVLTALLPALTAFSGIKFTELNHAVNIESGVAFVNFQFVAKHSQTLFNVIPATGKTLLIPVFVSAKVDGDGFFSEVWMSMDKMVAIEQLQLLEWAKILFPGLAGMLAGLGGGSAASAPAAASVPAAAPSAPAKASHSSTSSDMVDAGDGSDWFSKS